MNEITDLLFAQVATLGFPTKYPAINGPDATEWLEVIHTPNGPAKQLLSEDTNNQGFIRVIFHSQKVGEGQERGTDVQQLIMNAFNYGKKFFGTVFRVEIYHPPEAMGLIEYGHEVTFPVTIRYRAFKV